jgi:hypothetical protein
MVTPSKVFLESAHDDDRKLPVGTAGATWVDRNQGPGVLGGMTPSGGATIGSTKASSMTRSSASS